MVAISDKGNVILKHDVHGALAYTVSFNRLKALYEGIGTRDKLYALTNINTTIRTIIGGCNTTAFYAVLDQLFQQTPQEQSEEPGELKDPAYAEQKDLLEKSGYQFPHSLQEDMEAECYVLIIDEINRGNVSQIFGELITLIEEDKRLGNNESLLIHLPYSKKKFGVPSNLHLIGTMNTADRSVEALDTALRRRFSFTEMQPNGELLKNNLFPADYTLADLLDTINDRIELLLDSDHKIGHAYFINVGSEEDLYSVFAAKIIPLLQEYFYDDRGKIGLVLGEGLFEVIPAATSRKTSLAKFFNYDTDAIEFRDRYKLRMPGKEPGALGKALKILLSLSPN
ncbi:McrB family protein [Hufsiella ginkgonis]|uniref:AAA domain-containing protein n=1 Tax=Hufsiella ginkgonis TaxID=2695274 RepID=A0A7K1XUD0_9SPHI|nr:AAA domain-containing protein [Hufsiella ginkgonis]